MFEGKRVVVVMPAYNAAHTLAQTYAEIPHHIVDEVVLVDDASSDNTIIKAKELGLKHIIKHDENKGYGANQKSCYTKALALGADIVVMLHPDYQYTPKLLTAMISMLAYNLYDVILASRIIGKGALQGGMPVYKYIANRILTGIQNLSFNQKLSEYHTGYRGFTAQVLRQIDMEPNSDDFVFDNEMLSQIIYKRYRIGEVSCPTKYFEQASSINFKRSVQYGFGCLRVSLIYFLVKLHLYKSSLYTS